MKKTIALAALILPVFLTACSNDVDIQGRYTNADGGTSYQFLPAGEVQIKNADNTISGKYEYDAKANVIKLSSDQALTDKTAKLNEDGSIEVAATQLTRAVDESMLVDSTWKGNEGLYTFSLTFSDSEAGLATFSELVSYDEASNTYNYQTDDSITVLKGNQLLLDMTQYTVSEVTDTSMKLSIGGQSMVMNKYPKGTEIEFREGFQLAE